MRLNAWEGVSLQRENTKFLKNKVGLRIFSFRLTECFASLVSWSVDAYRMNRPRPETSRLHVFTAQPPVVIDKNYSHFYTKDIIFCNCAMNENAFQWQNTLLKYWFLVNTVWLPPLNLLEFRLYSLEYSGSCMISHRHIPVSIFSEKSIPSHHKHCMSNWWSVYGRLKFSSFWNITGQYYFEGRLDSIIFRHQRWLPKMVAES